MAYNPLYRITYHRLTSNSITTIDILSSGYTGSVITLSGDTTPLTITKSGDVSNIYTPTVGTGAKINIFATPLSLMGLFTADPQRYIVKCYNGSSGTNLFWQGFINSQAGFQEDYSSSMPTGIEVNANDGMNVLDALYYQQSPGVFYSGSTTIGQVFTNIFNKLSGITFNNIYCSHTLTTDGHTSNLFLNLKVINENFVDESYIPMTCRAVLDSILQALGFTMFFNGQDIYIVDPIDMNVTTNGKVYDLATFTESSSSVGGYIDLSGGTLTYFETGQGLDIVSQIYECDIKYNPYNIPTFEYDFNNMATGGTWYNSTVHNGNFDENDTPIFTGWTQTGSGGFVGVRENPTSDPTYMLVLMPNSGNTISYTLPYSVYNDDITSIKITFDGWLNTKNEDNNLFSNNGVIQGICNFYVEYSLMIGNQYWKPSEGTNGIWETGQTANISIFSIRDETTSIASSSVVNKWTTSSFTIPLTSLSGGYPITLYLYDFWDQQMTVPDSKAGWYYWRFLKNFKLDFVNSAGVSLGNNGTITRGNVVANALYKYDIKDISTTNGTGPFGISRGTFLSVNNYPLNLFGIYRNASVYTSTEQILLQSFLSEYEVPRLKLTANLNVSNYLIGLCKYLICDNKYLPGKAFFIAGYTYDDMNESLTADMVEITKSRESITIS